VDEMLHHCRAVARGARGALLVGDMPFLSYQVDVKEAIRTAGRFLKEGRMDAVKLEGGRHMAATVRAIVDAGIPVMGHIGMTLQTSTKLGGYGVQGQDLAVARALVDDALALEDAGAFSMVLSTIPSPLAGLISERLRIPTIGIGAGPGCDGQVLVFHSLVGYGDRPVGNYVKRYANVYPTIMAALANYRDEVMAGVFPGPEHGYEMSDEVLQALLQDRGG
jgi:3-methyl-2-oxobutanoate hydroxymethyltransferase